MVTLLPKVRREATAPIPPQPAARPAVNLLPPAVVDRARARHVARMYAAGAVAVLAISAGVWVAQQGQIEEARADLAAAKAANAEAQAELEPLGQYGELAAAVRQQAETIATAMEGEMSFGMALQAFAEVWPAGTVARTLAVDTQSQCPGPDPFTPDESLACLTFGVTVPDQAAAEALMASLRDVDALVDPFLTAADVTDKGVEVNGTVNLAPDLRTGRYEALVAEKATQQEATEQPAEGSAQEPGGESQ